MEHIIKTLVIAYAAFKAFLAAVRGALRFKGPLPLPPEIVLFDSGTDMVPGQDLVDGP